MGVVPFETFGLTASLTSAPIQADWIKAGTPQARNAILSRSADWGAYTMVWDCTAGSFEWIYDCDETVHILEGSIVLTDAGNPPRRLVAGDCVFFPKGAKVHWVVEGYVRKLAFMRETLPLPVAVGIKVMRRIRRLGSTVRQAVPVGRGASARSPAQTV